MKEVEIEVDLLHSQLPVYKQKKEKVNSDSQSYHLCKTFANPLQ
jgi:hypothetical protein